MKMLFHGKKIKQNIILWAKAKRFPYLVHVRAYVPAVERGGAGSGRGQAGEDRHERGLAGAVVAQQHAGLPLVQPEAQPIQRAHGAKVLAHVFHVYTDCFVSWLWLKVLGMHGHNL